VLAAEARRLNAVLVHYSTDYVFNGSQRAPYLETDSPDPINCYGATKLLGEQAVQAVGDKYLILRTSWVYGRRGKNFLLTVRRLAGELAELRVVDDQTGAPTWCRDLAEATAQISDPGAFAALSARLGGAAGRISPDRRRGDHLVRVRPGGFKALPAGGRGPRRYPHLQRRVPVPRPPPGLFAAGQRQSPQDVRRVARCALGRWACALS
jgi:hypothetical protein